MTKALIRSKRSIHRLATFGGLLLWCIAAQAEEFTIPLLAAEFDLHADNRSPTGITWADGRFHVVDSADGKVYAYRVDGRREASADFDLHTGNGDPEGIAWAHDRFYVVDDTSDKVFAYRADGQRDEQADFELNAGILGFATPSGIVHAEGRFHVVDRLLGKVYAFQADGRREASADFSLHTDNGFSEGIAWVGGRFHVVGGLLDKKAYAYRADGTREASADFDLHADNGSPAGIVHADGRFHVVDSRDRKVYSYGADTQPGDGSGGDHGDDAASAARIPANSTTAASLERGGDKDFFRIELPRTGDLVVETTGSTDTYGVLTSADGGLSRENDDGGESFNFRISLDDAAAGVYYIEVRGYGSGATGDYSLRVSFTPTVDTRPSFAAGGNPGDQSYTAGAAIATLTLPAASGGDGALAYTLEPDVPGLSFDAATLRLSGTPSEAGTYAMTYAATDADGDTATLSFSIAVKAAAGGVGQAEVFDLHEDNDTPLGITYANGRIYIVDEVDLKVYAYREGGLHDATADILLNPDPDRYILPWGIAYAGGRFHLVDINYGDTVYAYRADGRRDAAADFDLHDNNSAPSGMTWADGRIYVADSTDKKVYAYGTDGRRDASADFDLHGDNEQHGIAHANGRFYITDTDDKKVYAYSVTGQRDASADFDLHENNSDPWWIAYANDRFYVVDYDDKQVYVYQDKGQPGGGGITPTDFDLHADNGRAEGVAWTGERYYVVDSGADKVFAYSADGQREASADFDLDDANANPTGIAWSGALFHVVDSSDDKVYAYGADGRRQASSDFDLDDDNGRAEGIVWAGGRFYVVDRSADKAFAYGADGQREASSDFDLDGANGNPSGIDWSDGRFYVADATDDKVYAYGAGGERKASSDFDLHDANGNPAGIAWAGGVLLVADATDDKVYANAGPSPANTAPVVYAGEDRTVDDDTTVTLIASASDSDGTIASYSWRQTSGPDVDITNADSREASFFAPAAVRDATYGFTVTVVDDDGARSTDSVTINVTPAGFKLLTLSDPPEGKPSFVIEGRSAGVSFFAGETGHLKETLYESQSGDVRTRVIYDEATNEPATVVDEMTGNFVEIVPNGADRIDYQYFNSAGQYQSGFAFFREGDEYFHAEILGKPTFEGRITGQMSGANQTGSFSLVADQTATLQNITPVDDNIAEMLNGLAEPDAVGMNAEDVVAMLYESSARDAQTRVDYDYATNDPIKIVDKSTGGFVVPVSNGKNRVDLYSFDAGGYYLSGEAVYVENNQILSADIVGIPAFEGQLPSQLNGLNQVGGFVLMPDQTTALVNKQPIDSRIPTATGMSTEPSGFSAFDMTIRSAEVVKYLNARNILIAGGAVMVTGAAIAAAGAPSVAITGGGLAFRGVSAIFCGAFGTELVAEGIRQFKENTLANVSNEFAHDAIDVLTDVALLGLTGNTEGFYETVANTTTTIVNDVQKFVNSRLEEGRELLQKAKSHASEFTDLNEYSSLFGNDDELPDELFNVPEPPEGEGPPETTVPVEGEASFEDGTTYSLRGEVDQEGDMAVSGSSEDGSDSISLSGTVNETSGAFSGSFATNNDSGSIEGQTEPLDATPPDDGSGSPPTGGNPPTIAVIVTWGCPFGGGEITVPYDPLPDPVYGYRDAVVRLGNDCGTNGKYAVQAVNGIVGVLFKDWFGEITIYDFDAEPEDIPFISFWNRNNRDNSSYTGQTIVKQYTVRFCRSKPDVSYSRNCVSGEEVSRATITVRWLPGPP